MRWHIAVTNILIRVKVIYIDICGLSSTGKSHDLINRKPWQGLNSVRLRESVFWWVAATERILLCMTGSSTSRNAVVVSEVIKKMHLWGNGFYKGGSNPPSIFVRQDIIKSIWTARAKRCKSAVLVVENYKSKWCGKNQQNKEIIQWSSYMKET